MAIMQASMACTHPMAEQDHGNRPSNNFCSALSAHARCSCRPSSKGTRRWKGISATADKYPDAFADNGRKWPRSIRRRGRACSCRSSSWRMRRRSAGASSVVRRAYATPSASRPTSSPRSPARSPPAASRACRAPISCLRRSPGAQVQVIGSVLGRPRARRPPPAAPAGSHLLPAPQPGCPGSGFRFSFRSPARSPPATSRACRLLTSCLRSSPCALAQCHRAVKIWLGGCARALLSPVLEVALAHDTQIAQCTFLCRSLSCPCDAILPSIKDWVHS